MTYGYTVADAADQEAFFEAISFMKDNFGYVEDGENVIDIDGSMSQSMSVGADGIEVVSDKQIGYVAILSNTPLKLDCLHKWVK